MNHSGSICDATTASGERCKKPALEGLSVCAIHAGAPVGRPSKYTPEVATQIVQVLRAGGYVETAAAMAGISRFTFARWMASEEPELAAFQERVEEARAESETRNVALVAKAAQGGNWQAAAWLLERQYPERWGRPSQRKDDEPERPASDPFAEVDELADRRRRTG